MKDRLHRIVTGRFVPWPYSKNPELALTRQGQRHLGALTVAWAVVVAFALAVFITLVWALTVGGSEAWSRVFVAAVTGWAISLGITAFAYLLKPDQDITAF